MTISTPQSGLWKDVNIIPLSAMLTNLDAQFCVPELPYHIFRTELGSLNPVSRLRKGRGFEGLRYSLIEMG